MFDLPKNHLANILLAHPDAARRSRLTEILQGGGYAVRTEATLSDEALASLPANPPDLIVLAGGEAHVLSRAERIKNNTGIADIPIVLMSTTRSVDLLRAARDALAEDVLAEETDPEIFLARLKPLVRLSTMRHELACRMELALSVSETPLPAAAAQPDAQAPYTLLLLTSDDQDARLIRSALPNAILHVTENPTEAEDMLARRNFDAAIIAADNRDAALDLCSQLRINPRLFNLPALLVADRGRFGPPVEAYRRGASRLIGRPIDPELLLTHVSALVRRQRMRWRIRSELTRTLTLSAKDRYATTIYNRAFLERHLEGHVARAIKEQRHLSLICFDIPSVETLRAEFGEEAVVYHLSQLGGWIAGLLRAEDLAARIDGNLFCAVLPDTPIEEADVVMHRIAGVLAYTEFAVPDVFQPVRAWVDVGSAAVIPNDSASAMIDRARPHFG